MTTGLPNSRATNSYGRLPMTVETCAGPTKPSSGGARSALSVLSAPSEDSRCAIAGGVSTWLHSTLKFATPRRTASSTTSAVGGVVVSKPMAKNTTSRAGSRSASLSASAGE